MAQILFSNNATSTLAGPITNTATTVNVAAGSGTLFPQPGANQYFKLTFVDAATKTLREIVHVTAVSSDTFTITRGQEGTTQLAWNAGDIAANLNTAGTMAAMVQSASSGGAALFYAGQDSGTANNLIVTATTPVNSAPANGQIFAIVKGTSPNTAAVTLRIPAAGSQVSVVNADGTALGAGDWPGGALMFLQYTGSLYQVVGRLLLNFPGLPRNDAIAPNDVWAYYDISQNAHVYTLFSVLSSAIISQVASQPGSAALLNPQPTYCTEFRDMNSGPRPFQVGVWMTRILNTINTSVTGASLNSSTGGVTVPAGTYRIQARGSGHNCGQHQIRVLFPDGTYILGGTMDSHVVGAQATTNDSIVLEFRKTFTSSATIYLQHASFTSNDTSTGSMGDDNTGITTFNDAQLNLIKESGQP